MDKLYEWALDTLKVLVNTPSVSGNENDAVVFYERALREIGIKTAREGNNLISYSSDFNIDRPTVLLNSHIDTIEPQHGWCTNPYNAILKDHRLYGLGSNDAGASLVSLAAAHSYLIKSPQSYNLIYLVTCQEETSGEGGMQYMARRLPPLNLAIIGEPTQMQPATAEKGLMVLDCVVRGRAGHAARHEGESALMKALPIIQQIDNYKSERLSPLVGEVKCSVTQISAGSQHNVVPDLCTFVVDIRSTEQYTNEEILEIFERRFPDCEFSARFKLRPSSISLDHPFVQRAIAKGLTPFGSPTVSDQSFLDCQSVKMGVGDSARSHTPNEYVALSELRDGIKLYIDLLDNMKLQ